MKKTTFHMVESRLSKYQAGDSVLVTYTPNSLWVKTLGMDVLPGEGVQQWAAGSYVMKFERTVTAVDASAGTITLDAGISLTLDKTYYKATLAKITDSPSRIRESGVENLRFVSQYNGTETDVDHAQTAVAFANCRNCDMNGVTAQYYSFAAASVLAGAINVTVQSSSCIDPISPITGGWRYSFYIGGGQYTLYDTMSSSYEVEFSGTHDRNADQVFVVMDGERYEATLSDDGSFNYTVNLYLENGYHDVCVVQVAGGMESLPDATRTILINSSDSFDESLVSLPYGEEKADPAPPGQEITPPSGEEETSAPKEETSAGNGNGEENTAPGDGTEDIASPDPPTSISPNPAEEDRNGLYGTLVLCAVELLLCAWVFGSESKRKIKKTG